MTNTATDTTRRDTATWYTQLDSLKECPHNAVQRTVHHEAQRRARALRTHTRTARRLLESTEGATS
jgi:hypothetical protein